MEKSELKLTYVEKQLLIGILRTHISDCVVKKQDLPPNCSEVERLESKIDNMRKILVKLHECDT